MGFSAELLLFASLAGMTWSQGCYDDEHPSMKLLPSPGDTYSLVSMGFPNSCCNELTPCSWRIVYSNYLRIVFSDLDLPVMSQLQIRDKDGGLLPEQPEMSHNNVWKRPILAPSDENSEVEVIFTGANSTEGMFAGFKMVFTNTLIPPSNWSEKPTSDLCGVIGSPVSGREVNVKSIYSTHKENLLDCVWLVKNIHQYSNLPDVSIFVRIVDMSFTGKLEIRNNITSEGEELLNLPFGQHSLSTLDASQRKWGFLSDRGLYIRLQMPAYAVGNRLTLSPGVYRDSDTNLDEAGCKFRNGGQWFSCDSSQESIHHCLAPELKCNYFNNCASGRDESIHICPQFVRTTTTTTTTTTRRPTTTTSICSYTEKYCRYGAAAGTCIPRYDHCSTSCPYNKIRCNSRCIESWDRCTPCPSSAPFQCDESSLCYGYTDQCDGYSECPLGDDESDCSFDEDSDSGSSESGIPWWPFVAVAVPLTVLFLCCYYCCKKSNKPPEQTVNFQAATAGQPAAVSGVAPQRGYAPSPAHPIVAPSAPPPMTIITDAAVTLPNEDGLAESDPMMAPPPSYHEAISNSRHNLATGQEVPPPTYDSAVVDINLSTHV